MPPSALHVPRSTVEPHSEAAEAPAACVESSRRVSLAEAEAFCRRLARSHYENFTVASFFLPPELRQHFYNVYAYCRWSDDLADESRSPAESLALLDAWQAELESCYAGQPGHPIFVALARTIEQFAIPQQPFADLLEAFREDQRVSRYGTHEDVLHYCGRSANPVGRLVLFLGSAHCYETAVLSDSICTGLQLANFCQDVWRDWERGRLYLPQEELRKAGYTEAMLAAREVNGAWRTLMAGEVERARGYLEAGRPLVNLVPRKLKLDVLLFIEGGLAILRAIEKIDFDVLHRRPTVSKLEKARLTARAWWQLQRPSDPTHRGAAAERRLSESYAHCQALARRSASSFYLSFLLLPREKRRAMCALYAFLRRTDDIVDQDQSVELPQAELAAWRHSLRRALAGEADDKLLPALADSVRRFSIPSEYLEAVIDGVAMDLEHRRYATAGDLEQYCYRVASCVGFCCLHIWGFSDPEALEAGHQCGLAFQWTNILRDVKQDAAQGRIYLPLEDLARFNITPEELLSGVLDDRFRRLMHYEIARVEGFYRVAAPLSRWLSRDGRRAFAAMFATYHGLLAEIERRGDDIGGPPVRLGAWRKARIALRCLVRPGRAGAELPAPTARS